MPSFEPSDQGSTITPEDVPPSPANQIGPIVLIFLALGILYWCAYPSKIVSAASYDIYYAVWYSLVSPLSGITFSFPWLKGTELGVKASLASLSFGVLIGALAAHKGKTRPVLRGMVGVFAPLPMLIGWIPCAVIVVFLAVGTGFLPAAQPQLTATNSQVELNAIVGRLKAHVSALATDIGERSAFSTPEMLSRSADYVRSEFRKLEYEVISSAFEAGGVDVENLATVIPGNKRPNEIVVIGAHYDSALGTPAANDNGSGIAALLELARALRGRNLDRALHLVAFTTEEPPFFQTDEMGSMRYAKYLRENNTRVVAMLSLETLGYYSDDPGSQRYPPGLDAFYPHTGNFVAFVGNVGSFGLMRQCLRKFQQASSFPSQGAALPGFLPGVGWSDHWSFWQHDYNAIMVTDTAPFRYFDYHEASDTPEKIDYERMAQVVSGLEAVVVDLATVAES